MAKDRRKNINMHSSLPDKQPTPASLEAGEIAVNNAAGSEFISTKNSNDEVVRFSADGVMINWIEDKAVYPYKGTVTKVDEAANSSELQIEMNQSVAARTPHSEDVNGPDGEDTASFTIDMSKYAMIGANPTFSSITVDNDATFKGHVSIDGTITLPEDVEFDLGDPNDGTAYVRRNDAWEASLIQHGADDDSSVIKDGKVYINGVGSYNGTNEDSAQTLQEVLVQMNEHIYNAHAEVSLKANPSTIEKDVTTSITVSNTVQFLDKAYTPQSISVRVGSASGTEISTTPNGSVTASTSADTTYYVSVTFIDGISKTATATVRAYYPKYFGGSTASSVDSSAVLALKKQSITSAASGDYQIEIEQGEYMWLCVPSGMSIKRVTSNGFDVPMESAATVAVDGKGNYLCYRSSEAMNAGTVSIAVS